MAKYLARVVRAVVATWESVFNWNQKYLVLVFLNGLPSCLGATDASTGESREVRRKGLPIVNVPNALFLNRTVVQDNGDCHVMRSAAFIAQGKGTVLN